MPSLLQTKEQERAAKAWASVHKCLDGPLAYLNAQVLNAQQRVNDAPSDAARQQNLEQLIKRLERLRSEKGAKAWKQSYSSLAKKLPAMVLTNGLASALAFLRAKGKHDECAEEEVLYSHLSRWVSGQIWGDEEASLLERLIDPDTGSAGYRRATIETIAFMTWLKRFAEAELDDVSDSTNIEEPE